MKKNNFYSKYKNMVLSFVFIWVLYIIIHIIDLTLLFGIVALFYEFFIGGFIIFLQYSATIIRSSLPYVFIYFGLCVLSVPYTGYNLKFFGINLQEYKQNITFIYVKFLLKEYNYFILLVLHLIFFVVIFYFELYYNIFIIGIIISFYFFIGLNILIKSYLKKKGYTGYFNFFINVLLAGAIAAYISTIGEFISQEIDFFKLDNSEYIYNIMQNKFRFFLKLKWDKTENWIKMHNIIQNKKAVDHYLYLKKNVLNNNILNNMYIANAQRHFKYESLFKNDMLKDENINKYIVEKQSLKELNNNNNYIFTDNYNPWWYYNVLFNNNNNTNNNIHFSKYEENLNWRLHLFNWYGFNWFDFKPKELTYAQNLHILLKKTETINISHLLLTQEEVNYMNNYIFYVKYWTEFYSQSIKRLYGYNVDINNYKKQWANEIKNFLLYKEKQLFLLKNEEKGLHWNFKEFKLNFNYLELYKLLNKMDFIIFKVNRFIVWWDANFYILNKMLIGSGNQRRYTSIHLQYGFNVKNTILNFLKNSNTYLIEKKQILGQWYKYSKLELQLANFIDRNNLYINTYKKPFVKIFPNDLQYWKIPYYKYTTLQQYMDAYDQIINHNIFIIKKYNSVSVRTAEKYIPFITNLNLNTVTVPVTEKEIYLNYFTNNNSYYFVSENEKGSTDLDKAPLKRIIRVNPYYSKPIDIINPMTFFNYIRASACYNNLLKELNDNIWINYVKEMQARYSKIIEWSYLLSGNNSSYNDINDFNEYREWYIQNVLNYDEDKPPHEFPYEDDFCEFLIWTINHLDKKFNDIYPCVISKVKNSYFRNLLLNNDVIKSTVIMTYFYHYFEWAYYGHHKAFYNDIEFYLKDVVNFVNGIDDKINQEPMYKFKNIKNPFLDRSVYWKAYQKDMKELKIVEDEIAAKIAKIIEEETINASYSCPEERIVAEKLTLVHNRMIVADMICDTNLVTFVYPNDSIEDIIEHFKEQRFNIRNNISEELTSNFINHELAMLEEEETVIINWITQKRDLKYYSAVKITSDFKDQLKSYKTLQELLRTHTIKKLSDKGLWNKQLSQQFNELRKICGKGFKYYDLNHIMKLGIRSHNISNLYSQLIHDKTLRKMYEQAALTLKQIYLLALEERQAEYDRINLEVHHEVKSLYTLQKRMAIEKEIKIALEKEVKKLEIKKAQEVWTKKNWDLYNYKRYKNETFFFNKK